MYDAHRFINNFWSAAQWSAVDALIEARDPWCRGVVMLGLNAPLDELLAAFGEARGSRSCRGFAVGRTIFHEPSADWLSGAIDDAQLVSLCRDIFEQLIRAWEGVRKSGTALPSEVAA